MKFINRNLPYFATALFTLAIGLTASMAYGQTASAPKDKNKIHTFCDQNNSWNDENRVSFKELRESNAVAGGTIKVDGRKNGGVVVIGENRSDVLVRACVQTWAKTDEEARSNAANIRINTVGTIAAENPSSEDGWSVSYEVRVPRSSDVELMATNGGIVVKEVDGNIEFETRNGGVNLYGVAGSVKGKTTNGGVVVTLVGGTWKGSGMDVQTTNGGVIVNVPDNFAANVETGTVNGGFTSEIPALSITTENVIGDNQRSSRSKRITTSLNGGGPLVRILTTNGGVKINSTNK